MLQAAGLSIGERRLTPSACGISSGVARTSQLATLLWMSTSTWLGGCGRLWFQGPDKDSVGSLPDAPPMIDAAVAGIDAAVDAAADAPDDVAIASAPILDVAPTLSTTVSCGSAPQQASLVVTNKGNAALEITNATITGAAFQLKSTPVMIAPGAMGSFSILPPMAVVGTDLGGDVKHGMLKIESNAGIAMVDLEATVFGANLVMTAPQPLTFQGSSGACPAPQSVSIQNMGNSAATVGPALTGPFGFSPSSSADTLLLPGETLIIDVHVVTSSACTGAGTVGFAPSSGDPICAITSPSSASYNILGSSSSCFCS
ncbi:MAG TPA: hypothetical protein VLM79_13370 [Kofleriaceae bacterium]|nr:hypothetical protein [Kofleriaceae bacterium]